MNPRSHTADTTTAVVAGDLTQGPHRARSAAGDVVRFDDLASAQAWTAKRAEEDWTILDSIAAFAAGWDYGRVPALEAVVPPLPAPPRPAPPAAGMDLTRTQLLEALKTAGYTGPVSYTKPRLVELLAQVTA